MASKLKKSRAAGRFGPRYGKTVKARLVRIEDKQRKKQTCPFCSKKTAKRIAKGLWYCKNCDKKFASNTYYLED